MGKAKHRKKLKKRHVKLSEALLNLCAPYNKNLSAYAFESLIATTVIAWNIALSHGEQRQKMLIEANHRISTGARSVEESITFNKMIARMIQRKDELYPDDSRQVVDFEITESATERNLRVISMWPEDDD